MQTSLERVQTSMPSPKQRWYLPSTSGEHTLVTGNPTRHRHTVLKEAPRVPVVLTRAASS